GSAAWAATRYVGPIREADARLEDARLAYFAAPRPQRRDVIVLAIDEDTLSTFPFRSPIDRRFLAELIDELGRRNVRAVGLDITFDQPSVPADDRALLAAIERFPGPVIIAVGGERNGLTPRQLAFQSEYLARRTVGAASVL